MEYSIEIKQTLVGSVLIEADSPQHALQCAEQLYNQAGTELPDMDDTSRLEFTLQEFPEKDHYETLSKALEYDVFQENFYSAMDDDIRDAMMFDVESPQHKYWQLVDEYIAGDRKIRNLLDLAISSLTGWNLSTLIKNAMNKVSEFIPDEKKESLDSQIRSAASRTSTALRTNEEVIRET